MKKKIIFINQDTGYLMIDIANAFVEKGYECVLITGRIVERKISLDKRVKRDKIIRYNRNSIPNRIISWSIGSFQIWLKIVFKYRRDTLFIITNPPSAPLLPLLCRNRYYQLVFDLDLVRVLDVKIVKRIGLLNCYWKRIVRKVMNDADAVFTLTKGMAEMLQPFVVDKKVLIMPLWTDNSEFKVVNKAENPFVEEYQLEDKFVVMYSGNLGASTGVEPLIEVAHRTQNRNVLFLIIGEGIRKDSLIRKQEKYQLSNCMFLPWQPPEVLPFSLASADLAVVSLAGTESKRSIPSKLYNNMSVGSPILGIAHKESDLADTIETLDIGRSFEPDEIMRMVNFIDNLYYDKEMLQHYRINSITASKKFTASNISIILNNL